MKVQVLSEEAIRPSTPTPAHHRWMPLCMLDQVAPPIYFHLLLFYPATGSGTTVDKAGDLKRSLSVALAYFYPLAGRIRGPLSSSSAHIECNDEGAQFYEARVEGELAAVLRHPPVEELHQLQPNIGDAKAACDGRALLAIQFNLFDCGGSAIGVSMSHLVGDAATLALLLGGWADSACGRNVRHKPRFHAASVFPSADLPSAREPPFVAACSAPGAVPKRFVIRRLGMEKLRGEAYGFRGRLPTRVEAVLALVWRCAIRASGGGPQIALHLVNLRRKMEEKLSEDSFGNLWTAAVVLWEGDGVDDACRSAQSYLETKVREAVEKVDEGYARAAMAEGVLLPEIIEESRMGCWVFSSWCRFPFYETDFGWGQPAWVCCPVRHMKNAVVLMDARDGEGMEVWLWLGEQQMGRFQKDPAVAEFFSAL